MGLLTEYSFWFVILCLLLGAAYAFVLYFRANRESYGLWLRWTMAIFRFLAVSVISFLLLSPLIRQNLTTIEKPVVIIGQDNSQSMVLSGDSAYIRGDYLTQLNALVADLSEDYDVRTYSFGELVASPMSPTFSEKLTDISGFFSEIATRYVNRNVGAVILVSDGIYNYGADPYYAARDLSFPVYTVGIGDTNDQRDLFVKKVLHNAQVFMGDQFPAEIQVDALHCDGEMVHLAIKEKNKLLGSQDIMVRGNRFSRQVPLILEAREPGWHRYTVELTPVAGEMSTQNNRYDFFIEVLDVRTKILLVSDAPHPDIGSIREALQGNEKFELTERTPEEFLISSDTFALVIFYQVPSLKGIRISESVIAKLPAALFVLGTLSDIPAFNRMNTGLIINMSRVSFAEPYPLLNESFPYFTLGRDLLRQAPQYTPLQSPFGAYQYAPLTEVLAYQRINGSATRFPLISFTYASDQKRGFIAGENFWRWRLTDFLLSSEHKEFDGLIQKIVQYLSVKQDQSYFRVKIKSEFLENEPVEVQAEGYNKSYELINTAEATIVITDEEGKSYPFTFAPTGSTYFLRAGTFPPGLYTYKATVTIGQDRLEKRGSFAVTSVNLEAVNLTADHNLLYRIADSHGGQLIQASRVSDLKEIIRQNQEIHAVSYVQKVFSELINAPWVFLLILAFLTAEWALRKYSGV